jgi:plastocyanin
VYKIVSNHNYPIEKRYDMSEKVVEDKGIYVPIDPVASGGVTNGEPMASKKFDGKVVDITTDRKVVQDGDHYLITKVDPNAKTGTQTVEVVVNEKGFNPDRVEILVGDNVNFVWNSSDKDTVADDRYASVHFADNSLNTGAQKNTFTAGKNFGKVGEYVYTSETNGASGVVVVK